MEENGYYMDYCAENIADGVLGELDRFDENERKLILKRLLIILRRGGN